MNLVNQIAFLNVQNLVHICFITSPDYKSLSVQRAYQTLILRT